MKPSASFALRIFAAFTGVLILALLAAWSIAAKNPANFALALAAALAIGVSGSLAVALAIRSKLQSSELAIQSAVKRVGGGDLKARIDLQPSAPAFETAGAINAMASALQQRVNGLEAELKSLNAIVGAMEEGLIVVDAGKRVLMANNAARKMLSLPDGNLVGKALHEIARQPDLAGNIELSIDAGQTCSFEFQPGSSGAPVPPGTSGVARRFILARCSPLMRSDAAEGDRQRGAVAVLHDISELRRLERMRTEFVANVSHELRTPLTSLMGYLETLHEDGVGDAEEAQRFLLVCRRQAERLSRIVEDLLRLSRLENPQQEIAQSEVDLCEVVNTSVDQCETMAAERGIKLELSVPDGSAKIWGDRGLLVQAVSNLIENAIHYNREKGRVRIRLAGTTAALGEQWEVSVEDNGIGIPQEALGRIFERFYRIDKARSRERGGTGLGLSIVRHIALAHGASVHVESEVDKGSTFFLRFKQRETKEQTLAAAK